MASEQDDAIWQVGICDAHCHPTDIMASIDEVAHMKARVLTIMASRSQDQDLVSEVASRYLMKGKSDLDKIESGLVIPAFGWHPWFSHQLYDDTKGVVELNGIEHYRKVLSPSPDDEGFLRSLPAPRALSSFVEETERQLHCFPLALIGEVGLDRAFRLPVRPFHPPDQDSAAKDPHSDGDYTPGSREGRPLTPYRVSMSHQKAVLRAQLELAAKLQRPVSVHSVQAHGVVLEVLQSMWSGHERMSKRQQKRRRSVANAHGEREGAEATVGNEANSQNSRATQGETPLPFPPRICMHSYSGPADPLRQFLHSSVPADVFFSFSQCINFSTPSADKVIEVIKAVPDSQVLIESDFHCAGDRMDDLLLEIVKKVCEIKGWALRAGAQRLRSNWERFIFG